MLVDKTRGMATFVSDAPGGPYKIADKNPLLMSYSSCACKSRLAPFPWPSSRTLREAALHRHAEEPKA